MMFWIRMQKKRTFNSISALVLSATLIEFLQLCASCARITLISQEEDCICIWRTVIFCLLLYACVLSACSYMVQSQPGIWNKLEFPVLCASMLIILIYFRAAWLSSSDRVSWSVRMPLQVHTWMYIMAVVTWVSCWI